MKKPNDSNRRIFIKNMGILISLPFFESLGWRSVAHGQTVSKKRFIGCFFPNGAYSMLNSPMGRGNGLWRYGNGGLLENLDTTIRENTMVVRGLNLSSPRDQHLYGTAGLLSGQLPLIGRGEAGFNLQCGESIDQMIAKKISNESRTDHESLQIGYQYRGHPAFNSSAHQHYINAISWKTDTTPLIPNYSPLSLFNQLFAPFAPDQAQEYLAKRKKSILDFAMNQTRSLNRRLNPDDQKKLSQFLTQLRELETKLQNTNTSGCSSVPRKNEFESVASYQDHFEKMQRLLVLAMKCDLTSVATIMYNNGTGDPFNNHHAVAHRSVDPGSSDDLRSLVNTTSIYLTLFSNLVKELKEEGLLDDTLVSLSSNMAHGFHGNRNIPTLLAGNDPGMRFGREAGGTNNSIPMASFLIEILKEYGIQLNTLGNARNPGRSGQINLKI